MAVQLFFAGPVVDDDSATFTLWFAPVHDTVAERTSLRLHVAVAHAVGCRKTAVEDIDGARLANDLRFLTVKPSHDCLVSIESYGMAVRKT